MKLNAGWAVLAVAITACAQINGKTASPEPPQQRTVAEPVPGEAERVAKFYERLLTAKGSDLAAELEAAREAFGKDKSELNRLQLALLLSLPGTGFRDDSAALTLLNPFVRDMKEKNNEGSVLRPLGILLHSELLELRRADEALIQQSAKLKEEQRRAEALQQKLEAILDMEMKMIEREQNLPKKK